MNKTSLRVNLFTRSIKFTSNVCFLPSVHELNVPISNRYTAFSNQKLSLFFLTTLPSRMADQTDNLFS